MKNHKRASKIPIIASNDYCQQFTKLLLLVFCFVVLESACSDSNQKIENTLQSNDPVSQNSTVNEKAPGKEINAICQNPFYPTNKTRDREYRIQGDSPTTYTLTQSANGSTSFVETYNFSSGNKITAEWECAPEGLRNTEYTNFIPTPSGAIEMKTANSSGITLPNDEWETGKKWTTAYIVKVRMTNNPVEGLTLMPIKVDNIIKSIGQKIAVAGGEFEAARIDSTVQMDLPAGNNSTVKIKMSSWYAPQVGLIKQKVESPFGKTLIEYAGEK